MMLPSSAMSRTALLFQQCHGDFPVQLVILCQQQMQPDCARCIAQTEREVLCGGFSVLDDGQGDAVQHRNGDGCDQRAGDDDVPVLGKRMSCGRKKIRQHVFDGTVRLRKTEDVQQHARELTEQGQQQQNRVMTEHLTGDFAVIFAGVAHGVCISFRGVWSRQWARQYASGG